MVEVRDFLSLCVLLVAAYQDYKSGEIHLFVLCGLLDFRFPLAYLFLVFIMLYYPRIEHYIGGADLLIFALLYSRYGLSFLASTVLFASTLALLHCLLFHQRQLRFIPYILAGFVITIGMR